MINNIYNCHFTGSPLWDLFGKEVGQFERTWNVSIRMMLGLPQATHRYLIEPVSGTQHLKKLLIKRFISFLHQIQSSGRNATKQLLQFIHSNTESTTGNNVRKILRLTGKSHWTKIKGSDIDNISYCDIDNADKWRVNFVNELLEIKRNEIEVDGFSVEEIDSMMDYVCTS